MRNKRKAALMAALFMAMFLGILITIARMRHGSIVVMSYCFAVPGIVYVTLLLYRWITYDAGR